MKKFIFSISAVSMAILTACSGSNAASPTDETDALSDMTIIAETIDTASTENTDEYNIQIMQLTDDVSADIAINVVWSRSYSWAMGRDYVYVDSDGKIYEEHEMEEPMFKSLGACNETYSGEQFTEEELDEFLSINKDDEDLQKEILRRKGIKFGK